MNREFLAASALVSVAAPELLAHAYAEREFFYKNRRGNLSRLARPPMVFATFSRYRKVALW